jgi:hypothetical protein
MLSSDQEEIKIFNRISQTSFLQSVVLNVAVVSEKTNHNVKC